MMKIREKSTKLNAKKNLRTQRIVLLICNCIPKNRSNYHSFAKNLPYANHSKQKILSQIDPFVPQEMVTSINRSSCFRIKIRGSYRTPTFDKYEQNNLRQIVLCLVSSKSAIRPLKICIEFRIRQLNCNNERPVKSLKVNSKR